MPHPDPEVSPASVHTLPMILSCPICKTPLSGRQTVCSGKCRIERFRRKRETEQTERDAKVRLLLRTARESVDDAYKLLTNTH